MPKITTHHKSLPRIQLFHVCSGTSITSPIPQSREKRIHGHVQLAKHVQRKAEMADNNTEEDDVGSEFQEVCSTWRDMRTLWRKMAWINFQHTTAEINVEEKHVFSPWRNFMMLCVNMHGKAQTRGQCSDQEHRIL